MSLHDAVIAVNRFGLGPSRGDLRKIAQDPRGWLHTQSDSTYDLPPDLSKLPSSRNILRMGLQYGADQKFFRKQSGQRLLAAVNTTSPYIERLVWFWSNHFAVSVLRRPVLPYAEAFEREAIRPHVLGKFEDMLLAAIGHPAMQLYLDNHISSGPHAPRRGNLNENLAREILELHTLGIDGGYTPKDIREFALMLTGWDVEVMKTEYASTVKLPRERIDRKSPAFAFDKDRHEPGPKWFLGKVYKDAGVWEAERALRTIAAHPATQIFVSEKLARHFISDEPSKGAVKRIAGVFRDTDGDLREIARALIDEPEVWNNYGRKVKSPAELVISAARAINFHGSSSSPLFSAMESLGQMPFGANAPTGFPDRGEDWMGGQTMLERVDFCADAAKHESSNLAPADMARDLMGPSFSAATLQAINRAPSRSDAIGLILASREFQRR